MIINDEEISVFDITSDVKNINTFANKKLKAYDFMSNSWYHYNIDTSFWINIDKCIKEKSPSYSLWIFTQSVLEDTKINRLKGIEKSYIKEGIRSKKYRAYSIMKDNELKYIFKQNQVVKNNNKFLRFYLALEIPNINYINKITVSGYFLLLPKNIKEETIMNFLKNWNPVTNIHDKKLLEINKDIYSFLVENSGILIEPYNDSNYYEYKGEEYGYIMIDPLALCPIKRAVPASSYKNNQAFHEKYD